MKAQYLLVPKVQIRIRIFRICLRLGDSVHICRLIFLMAFYKPLFSAWFLWGFDPTTLGVEAQVSYHLGHRGKVEYQSFSPLLMFLSAFRICLWLPHIEAPQSSVCVRSPTLELPFLSCLEAQSFSQLPGNRCFALTFSPQLLAVLFESKHRDCVAAMLLMKSFPFSLLFLPGPRA